MENLMRDQITIKEDIPHFLKCFRVEKRMTQGQFAALAGISTSRYGRYERGEDSMPLEEFMELMKKCNMTVKLMIEKDAQEGV